MFSFYSKIYGGYVVKKAPESDPEMVLAFLLALTHYML